MCPRIAIVGAALSAAEAPYSDPDWEVWALPWRNRTPSIARYFEMHVRQQWCPMAKGAEYLAFLRSLTVPVYMHEAQPDIPASRTFPWATVARAVRRDYFASSIAYMLALAISMQPQAIGLWGVDLALDNEYGAQRPNVEWLLGLAEGRGIRIDLPPMCPLLSSPARYGLI